MPLTAPHTGKAPAGKTGTVEHTDRGTAFGESRPALPAHRFHDQCSHSREGDSLASINFCIALHRMAESPTNPVKET